MNHYLSATPLETPEARCRSGVPPLWHDVLCCFTVEAAGSDRPVHHPATRGACAIHFCTSIFNGFFNEFIFHRFVPSRRWRSLICLMAAASSEAGTICSPAVTAVRLPSGIALRQRSNWLLHHVAGQRGETIIPGSKLFWTLAIFFLCSTPSEFLRSWGINHLFSNDQSKTNIKIIT